MAKTLTWLSKLRYITKIGFRDAYSLIRVPDEDVEKIAICTCFSLFGFLVMPFGLINTPTTFQQYVNKMLGPSLDVSCTVCLEDVLIYSQTLQDHIQHVCQIPNLLQQAGLQV
jgi:hypothetical protein